MATLNGTDHQDNLYSCSNGIWSIGSGGPSPQSIPGMPASLVFDASLPSIPLNAANPGDNTRYDAILKVGDGGPTLTIPAGAKVAQGYQDSLNLNNHATVILAGADLSYAGPPGIRVVTVKGGSHLSATGPVVIHQHGALCDVQVDAWSDQSYDTSVCDLSLFSMADGSPILIRTRDKGGIKPGPRGQYAFLGCVEDWSYWEFKWAVRKVSGVKVGQTGPKWLA